MKWRSVAIGVLPALIVAGALALAGIPANVSQKPPAEDQANAVVAGSFTATGHSASFLVTGWFNVSVYGSSGPNGSWSGTVQLERSFDGGTTWIVAGVGRSGTQNVWSTANTDASITAFEPEKGMLYRLDCTTYTSGTINYRLSTTGTGATAGPQ
jgi:hypothetical protein